MAVSSLRERLSRLQGKTKNRASNVVCKDAKMKSEKPEKKSFFNSDNSLDDDSSLRRSEGAHLLGGLNFPDVDFNLRVTKSALFDVSKRLSTSYSFPLINPTGSSSLSQNSKTSKISKQYPKLLLQDQLYSLFPGQETLLDNLVNELVRDGRLRRLKMNLDQFSFNILILQSEYEQIVDSCFSERENAIKTAFFDLIRSDFTATQIDQENLLHYNMNIPQLINRGLICISTGENMYGLYNLSIPHLGGLLRVIKNAVKWITDNTLRTRERMILDSDLRQKWFKSFEQKDMGKTNQTNQRIHFTTTRVGVASETTKKVATGPGINIIKFRGIGLDWILALMIGVGIFEVYESPVGTVYKATGKSI
ncbi:hypothetical protein CANINC_003742 [Pichia inconspicua]|uniref:Uncharacterized protein n=1 Tax=Pichia inconspicua TaxID=52247 RepID=A0A4T0WXS1_9ASCO|nr:hypothetical protein CANINC_003742 [[Candida] inconspicua]